MEARVLVRALLVAASTTVVGIAAGAEPTKDQCIDADEAAQPLAQTGKLLEAKEKLLVCMASTCPGPVRDDCTQRLADVAARTPTIVFAASDDADHDLAAVRVTIDSRVLVDRLDGSGVPVDPGEHRFVFEAEGLAPEKRTLVVREGEKNRHERIMLVPPGAAPAPAEGTSEMLLSTESPSSATAAPGRTQRLIGLAIGGVGVGALAAGGVFGVLSKITYEDALNGKCKGQPNECTTEGVQAGQSAHGQALASTIAFAVGGALVAGGVAVYLTAPRSTAVTITASGAPGGANVGIGGRW
jgi:hypothetical protein